MQLNQSCHSILSMSVSRIKDPVRSLVENRTFQLTAIFFKALRANSKLLTLVRLSNIYLIMSKHWISYVMFG